jgi:hypothetical protein
MREIPGSDDRGAVGAAQVLGQDVADVVVTGWLRRVRYADGSEETPAVVLEVDNPEHPGELALTGEDLGSLAEHLLALRRALGE